MTHPPNKHLDKKTDLTQKSDCQSGWESCNDSVIAQMLNEQKRSDRRRAMKRIGLTSIGAFSILAGATLWQASRQPTMKDRRRSLIIPISCEDAMGQIAYYHREELDDGSMRQVTHHLRHCKGCKIRYEKTYDVEFVSKDARQTSNVSIS